MLSTLFFNLFPRNKTPKIPPPNSFQVKGFHLPPPSLVDPPGS